MHSFTLLALVSSLAAVSVSADKLTAATPKGLVQCAKNTLNWSGGVPPYAVYVFTGCEDDKEDPIFFVDGLKDSQVDWWVDSVSGSGILLEVVDSTGASDFADEAYVGGDASDKKSCAASISAAGATSSAAAAAVETTSTAGPTTALAVGNAAKGPTFSGSIATETAAPVGSGASALSVSLRPVALVLGSLALGAFTLL